MSAGGLSYSGLVNHGKVNLPSVETWGTNMNILRDPPKSYYTRKIDKVGENSSITEMIDDSGNRACEAIQVYARGINPSVSVSYSNNGNNGGQRSGGITTGINSIQSAKLPYRIMDGGAFRPPILLQQDLLPLSRLPRVWTSVSAKKNITDFSRKLRTCGTAEQTKEVYNTRLKACVRPTAVYKVQKPIKEPFEVKYVIQPTIKNSVNSGIRNMDITQKHTGTPTKEIDRTPLHARAQANFTDVRHVDNNVFNTERYLQDTNPHGAATNISSKKHYTPIEDIFDISDLPIHQNINNISTSAAFSGVEKTNYLHDNIELSRNLPEYNIKTNITDSKVHKTQEYENKLKFERNIPLNSFVSNPVLKGFSESGSRDIRLADKVQPGGFSGRGQIPMARRTQETTSMESEKAKMNRVVMESMQGRFQKPSPLGR
jgi:hypothetical protein